MESDVSFLHKNSKRNDLDEADFQILDENVARGGGLGLCLLVVVPAN